MAQESRVELKSYYLKEGNRLKQFKDFGIMMLDASSYAPKVK